MQTCATFNIDGPTVLENVPSAVVCKRMQQLTTMVGRIQPLRLYKLTEFDSAMRLRCPNNVGIAVPTDATLFR